MTPDHTPAPAETPKPGPSNLQLRTIYGLLGAALLVGSVWFSPWTFGLFFAFVQAVMLWEFYRMMRAGGYAPGAWLGIGVSLAGFFLMHWTSGLVEYGLASDPDSKLSLWKHLSPAQHQAVVSAPSITHYNADFLHTRFLFLGLFALILLAYIVTFVLREVTMWPRHKQPFGNVGAGLTGIFYIGVPMSLLNLIAFSGNAYDYRRVIVLLFLIWSSDIGAYAAGKTFGKHKLAPKISPGKTWEGFAGGVVLTLAMGWALGYLIPELPLAHRLVAAGVVAVFGPLGDLAESMLKRSVGVKDSGSIMPGHGGLLDRFDAFLLVLPVLVLLQLLF